jgi:AcrR family transcriptional regulator
MTKSERTREKILETALTLFAEKGFTATTMRDIATRAECSLGLAYRYFESKEMMVLALYERLVSQLAEEATRLEPGTLGERWQQITRADVALLTPHRETLAALFGTGLTPGSPTQVLGENVAPWRNRVREVYRVVLTGAKDAPKGEVGEQLVTFLYAGHLLFVLFWLQDPTPGQRATQELIGFTGEMLGRMGWALKLPWAKAAMTRLGGIIAPLFGEPSPVLKSGESHLDGAETPTLVV